MNHYTVNEDKLPKDYSSHTDAMLRAESLQGLAKKLDKMGFYVFGENDKLCCYVKSANEIKNGINYNNAEGIELEVSYKDMRYNGIVPNHNNLTVNIVKLGINIDLKLKDFKNTFRNDGTVFKAINEYKAALKQLRKTIASNIDLAVTLTNV